jgi:hypothetical protein
LTGTNVSHVDAAQPDDVAPPPGTAIVRPLRHFRVVRERYLQRFADPTQAPNSRSARAWAWALGETATAPVTDRHTPIPPGRSEIEAEIAVADERRLRGDHENRADAAATILRWLIGEDDHVPVRGENVGELVGGFGDVVRSRQQIADVLADAIDGHRQATRKGRESSASPADKQFARRDADYLGGAIATLEWILGQRAGGPITSQHPNELTARELKTERLHAEDMMESMAQEQVPGRMPQFAYSNGVKSSITWLLGDCATPPITSAAHAPNAQH